jgi:integrase
MRFHDLRHSCATLLLKRGIHPKIAQERLAHAVISTTMDTYSHVIPTMQKEANKQMDEIFKKAR